MPANFIDGFEDENGARVVAFKKNLLKRMMINGIEVIGAAVLSAYTYKSSDFHPAWPLGISAIGGVSAYDFYVNARKYFRKLPRLQRDRLRSTSYLGFGVITFFTSVHAFSEALKCDNKLWIPCLGVSAFGYRLALKSVSKLGRTVLNRSSFMKCCQLLFGPTLIKSAGYYLLSIRQHDEEWIWCLPFVVSAIAANHISLVAYERVESNNEPRWLLFKGIELLTAGILIFINSAVLVTHFVNNEFNSLFTAFFIFHFISGIMDIKNSLKIFQECVEMEAPVYYCICGMIGGPIVFVLACASVRCVGHPIILPVFMIIAGTGVTVVAKSVIELHHRVPLPVFEQYCQRVLGPVVTVCSSLAAAYVGYFVEKRSSLVMVPLIAAGIYTTYKGFRRRR